MNLCFYSLQKELWNNDGILHRKEAGKMTVALSLFEKGKTDRNFQGLFALTCAEGFCAKLER